MKRPTWDPLRDLVTSPHSLGPSIRQLVQERDEFRQTLVAISRLHPDDVDAAPAIARGALRGTE